MAKRRRPKRQKKNVVIDIVIPVYGQPEFTRQSVAHVLKSAEAAGVPYRIIVVDDQSPDQAAMADLYGQLQLVKNVDVYQMSQNSGFPATANYGAKIGRGKYLLFVNSDCFLEEEAVSEIIQTFESDPLAGVVGGKLLFHPDNKVSDNNPRMAWIKAVDDSHGIIQHAGIAFNDNGPLHLFLGWPGDAPRANRYRTDLQAVTGALLATPRSVWDQVTAMYRQHDPVTNGGFNHVYGRGTYEDIEYCIAVRQPDIGRHVVYNPKVVGVHYTGLSVMHTDPRNPGYALQRNAGIFHVRCGDLVQKDDIVRW